MTLCIKQLNKTYKGAQTPALSDVNIQLNKGEIVGFLGPNGAGKSTLMKIITGYLKASSGSVTINGIPMHQDAIEAKKFIGYLPEQNPLYLDMYIKEFLTYVADCYNLGKNKKHAIDQVIEQTGLTAMSHKKIKHLSKGYKQRVGLAQALIHNPDLLILDEPTTGLDPNQLVEIRQLIQKIGQNKTVLFSTHVMQEVAAICQRVIIINEGQIIADTPVDKLRELSKVNTYEVEYDERPSIEDLQKISTDISHIEPLNISSYRITASSDIRGLLFNHASQNDFKLLTLKEVEKSIENIFHQLTSH